MMDRWQAIATCALLAMAAYVVVAALRQHGGRMVTAASAESVAGAEARRDLQRRAQHASESVVDRASSSRPSSTDPWQPVPIPASRQVHESLVVDHASTRLANCCKSLRESGGPHAPQLRKAGVSCDTAARGLTEKSDPYGQALAAAILGAMQEGLRRAGLPACTDSELPAAAKRGQRAERSQRSSPEVMRRSSHTEVTPR